MLITCNKYTANIHSKIQHLKSNEFQVIYCDLTGKECSWMVVQMMWILLNQFGGILEKDVKFCGR